ncbi:MAG: class I SAM-dependent methyltransferase, partial [Pseudomonadota bacterium]
GAGRSTRFLKSLGFNATGVDISQSMLVNARRQDAEGNYFQVGEGDLSALKGNTFNLILSAFPLCSITTQESMVTVLSGLKSLLATTGRLISVEATEVLYTREWVSFSMAPFPQNARAKSGDPVSACFRNRMDMPVTDTFWTDEDYSQCQGQAGLARLETLRPLADGNDPGPWISEQHYPPWVIYVLANAQETGGH